MPTSPIATTRGRAPSEAKPRPALKGSHVLRQRRDGERTDGAQGVRERLGLAGQRACGMLLVMRAPHCTQQSLVLLFDGT